MTVSLQWEGPHLILDLFRNGTAFVMVPLDTESIVDLVHSGNFIERGIKRRGGSYKVLFFSISAMGIFGILYAMKRTLLRDCVRKET